MLGKESKEHLPPVDRCIQPTVADVRVLLRNQPTYEEGMFLGIRKGFRGIFYSTELVYHSWIQDPEAVRF
jgi:hypothetical protein